jgi:hypothetical protein
MRQRQRGITFIGLLFIIVLFAIPVYAVIRLTPVYLNYMSVSRSLESLRTEFKGTPDPGGMRRSLEKHWQIDDITGINVKDIELTRDGSATVVHAAYDDKVPYIANVSLLVSFDKTVRVE